MVVGSAGSLDLVNQGAYVGAATLEAPEDIPLVLDAWMAPDALYYNSFILEISTMC